MFVFQRCKSCGTVHYNFAIRNQCYKCDNGILEILPDGILSDPNRAEKSRAILAHEFSYTPTFRTTALMKLQNKFKDLSMDKLAQILDSFLYNK